MDLTAGAGFFRRSDLDIGLRPISLGIDPEDLDISVHQVLLGKAEARDVILATADGVDLLPATIELARAEADRLTRTGREHALKIALESLAESLAESDDAPYDWILLDCPPSLGVLTVAALTAADGVLIPLQCETLSHRANPNLTGSISPFFLGGFIFF